MSSIPSSFTRKKVPFQMMGQTFNYEFLPNIHLTETLSDVLELMINLVHVDFNDKTVEAREGASPSDIMEKINNILSGRVYTIIKDVLHYQNDTKIEMNDLLYKSSALEVVTFLNIVMSDDEIHQAMEALKDGLGKLKTRLGIVIPLPKQNSTLSSSPNLEETTNT